MCAPPCATLSLAPAADAAKYAADLGCRTLAPVEVDARLLAWVALSALLIATPGPDTALIIRNALAAGPRASTMSALGVAVGTLIWVTASAVGIGVLLERSSTAFTILKLAGAAYLCYLGLRSLLSKLPEEGPTSPAVRHVLGGRSAPGRPGEPARPDGRRIRGHAAGLADRVRPPREQAGTQRVGDPRSPDDGQGDWDRVDRARRPARFRAALSQRSVRFPTVLANALGVPA